MDELKKALAGADDEYLAGLSNKGILKRAYKDLESAAIQPGFIGDTADVIVDNAHCTISVPIAGSTCSCPSRTVCRHIITAVLWLKTELLPKEKTEQEEVPQARPKLSPLEAELTDTDLDTLKKAMKKKYYNSFIEKARTGILPILDEGSTITADIYEENVTVKLLSPLDYSACTCKSKTLCRHKAAVILAWKLKHNRLSLDSLIPIEDDVTVSEDKLHDSAEYSISFLGRLLSDGLVRTPDNAPEYAEANALICHNAGFAEGERLMREIGGRLSAYNAHRPEFSTDGLFSLIMETYLLMRTVLAENDPKKLSELTGEFKSTYHIIDDLELIPLTKRDFSSPSGYAGDIYYFVNISKSGDRLPFLTFSDVRPTFYDNSRRGNATNAPWGLYGLCSNLLDYELRLMMPKVSGIKLSSSNDTHAEVICKPDLNKEAVYEKIYTDFSKIIEDHFGRKSSPESETLVMIMPEKCISSVFSETEQTLTIIAEDFHGQRLRIRARYSGAKKDFFTRLAKVGEIMLSHPERRYVIFGNAFVEDGRLTIYPIDVFDKLSVPEPRHEEKPQAVRGHSRTFLTLFTGISDSLCDMIQCGINSYDMSGHLADSAEECECMGLTEFSGMLKKLSSALSAKQHTYSDDNSQIISLTGDIYEYIRSGIRVVEAWCAEEALCTLK